MAWYVKEIGLTDWFKKKFLGLEEVVVRARNKKGQYVKEGQVIGKMGSTGRAVGAHLHYEIKVCGKSVDPYNFITKGRNLLSSTTFKR